MISEKIGNIDLLSIFQKSLFFVQNFRNIYHSVYMVESYKLQYIIHYTEILNLCENF